MSGDIFSKERAVLLARDRAFLYVRLLGSPPVEGVELVREGLLDAVEARCPVAVCMDRLFESGSLLPVPVSAPALNRGGMCPEALETNPMRTMWGSLTRRFSEMLSGGTPE